MTQHFYADISTKVAANMGATRPGTVDVQGTLLTDFDGTLLAANFDIRIENEILRVTSISVAGGGTGIDRWSVSHIGGAAASTHQKGQEIEVVLTPEGLSQYITDLGGGGSTTLGGDTDVDFTEVALAKGDIIVYNLADAKWENLPVGTDGDVLTANAASELGVHWAAGGGGGSGASTTDHFIVGQGGEADTDLSAKIIIPGLSGSPDIRVAGANDFEFDGGSTITAFNGLTAHDEDSTAKSHLFMKQTSNGGADAFKGIILAAPAALPFTVTSKVSFIDHAAGNFSEVVMFVTDSATAAGNFVMVGQSDNHWRSFRGTNLQTLAGLAGDNTIGSNNVHHIMYLRLVVNSVSSVDAWVSFDGVCWFLLVAGQNPGFGGTRYVGLAFDAFNSDAQLACDWIRFS